MRALRELTQSEANTDAMPLMEAVRGAMEELYMASNDEYLDEGVSHARRIRSKDTANFNKFFNSNKELVKDASVIAVSKYQRWNKNSRKTVTLHAKDANERRTIGDIVDVLTKSNKFKIHKMKYHMGRKIWILKKQ